MSLKANGTTALPEVTTTDAETVNWVVASQPALSRNYAVGITLHPVNTSGTATVTAMPQGSVDETEWFDLETSAATVNNAGTVANTSFEYADAYYQYYRVKLVSTGTGVTTHNGEITLKSK